MSTSIYKDSSSAIIWAGLWNFGTYRMQASKTKASLRSLTRAFTAYIRT